MAEYIEKQALIDAIYADGNLGAYVEYIIDRVPSADVVPVRHGRWIKTDDFSDEQIDWVVCDRCKAKIPDFDYSYCPNCGCKMDGGGET